MTWLWTWLGAVTVVGGLALAVAVSGGDEALQVREVQVTDDPRVLIVTYAGPSAPCEAPTRVTVEESDSKVAVHAWAGDGPDGVCPAIGRLLTAEVELDAELGDRPVVDGRNDEPVVIKRPTD